MYSPLESLIELFFTTRINFWDISWTASISFFFSIQNIKSNCRIIFLQRFPIICFWQITYSFLVIFIYKRYNIGKSFWIPLNFFIIECNSCYVLNTFIICIFHIYCCFFLFYPDCRINIGATMFKIFFMTFVIHQLN